MLLQKWPARPALLNLHPASGSAGGPGGCAQAWRVKPGLKNEASPSPAGSPHGLEQGARTEHAGLG